MASAQEWEALRTAHDSAFGRASPPERANLAHRGDTISVGVMSVSSVVVAGLQTIVKQVPFVGHVGCPAADVASVANYDLLLVDDSSVSTVPAQVRARVLVAVHSTFEAQSALAMDVGRIADGYVDIDNVSTTMLGAIMQACLNGEYPMPPGMRRSLLRNVRRATPVAVLSITARETQALRYVADGLSNEQVARHLGISPHGVKRLIASVMVKLDASNRTSAVIKAIAAGVLTCPNHRNACSADERNGGFRP